MAKTKTIMTMTPQELLKMFVASVGEPIKAEIRTAEITIKANTDAAIKAAEERIKRELRLELASKQDIARLEHDISKLKSGQDRIEHKLEKKTEDHEERLKRLEKPIGLTQSS